MNSSFSFCLIQNPPNIRIRNTTRSESGLIHEGIQIWKIEIFVVAGPGDGISWMFEKFSFLGGKN